MSEGKHSARVGSFDDMDFGSRRKSRRKKEKNQNVETEVNSISNENVNYNIAENLEQNFENGNNIYDNQSDDDNYDGDDYYDDYDEESEVNIKKIIIIVVAFFAIVAIVFGVYKLVTSRNNENVEEPSESEEIPVSVAGYRVIGKIKIDSLNVSQYILSLPEDEALKNGVVKLYGPSLNAHGNLCIAGHNYDGVFKELEKLNIGDEITMIDTTGIEYEYKVTSVKDVEPDDLECLIQDESKVEITLITCSTGSLTRTIVKAEQVSNDNV